MAVAIEDGRHLQAGYSSPRERSAVGSEVGPQYPASPFLHLLNPLLPRPPAEDIVTLDVSVFQRDWEMIHRLARDPHLRQRIAAQSPSGRRERVAFSNFGRKWQLAHQASGGIVEAGQNSAYNPLDGQYYPGPYVWGNNHNFQDLTTNLIELNEAGLFTTESRHVHPPDSLPVLSIPDNLILLMQRLPGENVPLLNAATVSGRGGQMTALRVAESRGLLTRKEIEDALTELGEQYDNAGGSIRERWKGKLRLLWGTAKYDREKAAYDAYIQAARGELEVSVARQTGLVYLISTDGVTAEVKPYEEIVRQLQAKQDASRHQAA